MKWPLMTLLMLVLTPFLFAAKKKKPEPERPPHYDLLFIEGLHAYDATKDPKNLDNKYLARVILRKNGAEVTTARGSTFPDSPAFYLLWFRDHKKSPRDKDLEELAGSPEARSRLLQFDGIPKDSMEFVVNYATDRPVFPSGIYAFAMELHQDGAGAHGHPYAPRLLGGTDANPYFPGTPSLEPKDLVAGGFLRSITPNVAQGGKRLANGINVHDGRRSSTNEKDSEGCLTIDPRDWESFIAKLPSPEEWTRSGAKGNLWIIRY
jgi:hypothetical protein